MEKRKLIPIWHSLGYKDVMDNYKYVFDNVTIPDYGGAGVDLNVNDCENGFQLYTIKTESDKEFLGFAARNYCLPFTNPNEISYLSDPCLKVVDRFLLNQRQFCSRLSNFRRKNIIKQLPILHETYETLKQLNSTNGCSDSRKPYSISIPKQFIKLLEHFPDPFPTLNSNWLYTGGCLTLGKDLTLLYSGGERFENLVSLKLKESEDSDSSFTVDNKNIHQINQGNKIHQIVYQETMQRCICAVRKKCRCDIFSVSEKDGNLDFKLLKTNHSKELLSSVRISPHVPGEIITATYNGYIQLQSLYSNQEIWKTKNLLVHESSNDLSNDWWLADFGAHPRSLLCLDRNNFTKSDLRSKESKPVNLLSKSNQFIQGEELMLFKASPLNNLQYFTATTNHLALIDERFLQKPIHLWNHHLKSPPLYWSHASLHNEKQLLFFLSSQNSRETSCLQLDTTFEQIQPKSLGSMWHVASPEDFVKILTLQGVSLPSEISTRTSLPIIGVQAIPLSNKRGFAVFQLTSVGDIYFQDYFPQLESCNEKTYHYGAGCEFLDCESVLAKCRDWFKEAYREPRPLNKGFDAENKTDVNDLLDCITKGPSSSDTCPVCFENSKPTGKNICTSCGCEEETAFNLLQVKENGGIISRFDFLTSEICSTEDDSENLQRNKFNLIDLNKRFDPFSQKLLSVWLERQNLDGEDPDEEEAAIFTSILHPQTNQNKPQTSMQEEAIDRDNLENSTGLINDFANLTYQDTTILPDVKPNLKELEIDNDFFDSPKPKKKKTCTLNKVQTPVGF